jgi:hypothetical protein
MRPLRLAEARRFLAAAEGHRLEALLVLAITTDMRQGELWPCAGATSTGPLGASRCATRWCDWMVASGWAIRRLPVASAPSI